MIVRPDFLDHWKTRSLVELTGNKSSPLAVLRLWAYCHSSKEWRFPKMTSEQLAMICDWRKLKPACHEALAQTGFIEPLDGGYAVHDWQVYNAQLIQKWNAGKLGGRPASDANRSVSAGSQPQTGANREESDLLGPGLDEKGINSSDKASPRSRLEKHGKATKPKKLQVHEKELADRIESFLADQWANDSGKWIRRIKSHFNKCARVIAEGENALKEDRINTTPAQYLEHTWQEFV